MNPPHKCIHSSQMIYEYQCMTSHKPTSVRNKPGYIRTAAHCDYVAAPSDYQATKGNCEKGIKICGRPMSTSCEFDFSSCAQNTIVKSRSAEMTPERRSSGRR